MIPNFHFNYDIFFHLSCSKLKTTTKSALHLCLDHACNSTLLKKIQNWNDYISFPSLASPEIWNIPCSKMNSRNKSDLLANINHKWPIILTIIITISFILKIMASMLNFKNLKRTLQKLHKPVAWIGLKFPVNTIEEATKFIGNTSNVTKIYMRKMLWRDKS